MQKKFKSKLQNREKVRLKSGRRRENKFAILKIQTERKKGS